VTSTLGKTGRPLLSPLEVARVALARGRGIEADLEAYVEIGRTVEIKVYARDVESVTVAEPRGIGIRAIREGRTGYAFTSDLSAAGLDRALAEVRENLQAADGDPFACLPAVSPRSYAALPGVWHPGVSEMGLEQKTGLALEAEAAALALPGVEAAEEGVYSDEETRVAIASTRGVEAEAERSYCFVYVMAHAGRDEDRQSGLGFSAGRGPLELDPEMAGREAGQKALALLGARPCRTGSYTAVLDREVAAALLVRLAEALSADAVQKGRSVFAGRLDTLVASPALTLLDDGLDVGGLAACPFDGEGMPQQRTSLIDAGVLRSYLYDTRSACREGGGASSTGNAARSSYRSLPRVGATNLVVTPGRGTLDDLLRRVGEGLYVESVAGLHSGVNPMSGEISVGVTGRLIEGGCVGAPVREVTLATDFAGLLGGVLDLSGDARWIPLYGSVCTPALAVREMAISGA
jgi:PmbA protein